MSAYALQLFFANVLLNHKLKKWKTEKGNHYGKIFTGYAELCVDHENPGKYYKMRHDCFAGCRKSWKARYVPVIFCVELFELLKFLCIKFTIFELNWSPEKYTPVLSKSWKLFLRKTFYHAANNIPVSDHRRGWGNRENMG